MRRRGGVTGLVIPLAIVLGCSTECDEALIDEAVEFVNTHLDCEADSDCAVVHTGCTELPDSALVPACTNGSCRRLA